MILPSKKLSFALCALSVFVGCAAGDTVPPQIFDDVTSDKLVSDDTLDETQGDVVGFDLPTFDLPGDSIPDASDDSTDDASEAAADAAPDVAPDAPCTTHCSGACSDPMTDAHNCGLCGNDCTLRPGVDPTLARCVAGRCAFMGACMPGRANCSGNPDDGCEAMINTSSRCGTCTNVCRDPTPNCGAMAGAPGGYACTSGCVGTTPMRCGATCVDTATDPRNCGACGLTCAAGLSATAACAGGRCVLMCNAGYGDCDGNVVNGCETYTRSSSTNCGMCGNVCPAGPGGSGVCSVGVCTITCATGTGNCDGNVANGCETDTRTSVMNCGACGNACVMRAGSAAACVGSACTVTCAAGYGNCNGLVTDGCESQTATDPLNCGACARRCAAAANATPSCADSACGITCLTGYGNCDGNGLNGCETPLNADARNCGACGTVCPTGPGAGATCVAGHCGLSCMAGFGDCNTNPADGCETDMNSSITHCGSCSTMCTAPADGHATCMMGSCQVTCSDGYMLTGGLCLRAPPRAVSPPGGGITTTRRPRFRVALPSGETGARVEVCGDRACTSVATTITLTGASGDSTISLAPGTYYWRATGTIAGAAVTPPGVVNEFTVMAGTTATVSSYWGPTLDAAADRYTDLMVGYPSSNYVQHWNNTSGSLSSFSYTTRSGAISFGASVASAGDVNADGYGDGIVGAQTANTASLFHGTTSGFPTTATTTITGPTGVIRFGASVSSAGDVNGDGYGDVIVGAPGSNRAFLYFGRATGVDTTSPVSLIPTGGAMNFGISVAGLGDVNADGFGDIAVGTDGAGIVYVWYGSAAGLGATPTGLSMPSGAVGFGRSVSGAGDVNGDGYPDVIVGAYGFATAYIFFGGASGLSSTPSATLSGGGTQFGFAVDGAGDVNGDGFCDVIVGAPGADRAYVFNGAATGVAAMPSTTLTPTYAGYSFGTALSGIGDFNNDGFADFVIASPGRAVQIYRGSSTGASLYATFPGLTSFGASVASRAVRRRPRS